MNYESPKDNKGLILIVEDLGETEGVEKASKTLLVDADTIAYAAALGAEYAEEVMPEAFYTPEEYKELIEHPFYSVEDNCVWHTDIEAAVQSSVERIKEIQGITNTKEVELYFTEGKNFRYQVYDMYKANRKGTRYPSGLSLIKHRLMELYTGEICKEYEADDLVVMLKRTQPTKYILTAVDKDVLKSVPGKHFNYYRSERYGIEMKWQEIDIEDAYKFCYLQTLMGDSTDNIPGCPGIGPKKAETALKGCDTPQDLWSAVVKAFKSKKLTEKEAIRDMRLVNMHQLTIDKEIALWNPPL